MSILERLRSSAGGTRGSGSGDGTSRGQNTTLEGLSEAPSSAGWRGGSTADSGQSGAGSTAARLFRSSGVETGSLYVRAQKGLTARGDDPAEVKRFLRDARSPAAALEARVKQQLYLRFQSVADLPKGLSREDERATVALEVRSCIQEVLEATGGKVPDVFLRRLEEDILDGILGFGPIQKLLDEDDVSEVMVNGTDHVYVEYKGKLRRTSVRFRDPAQLHQVIEKITIPIGRRCDETYPYCDARLADGSRVNIIIPPLSLNGPCITIRRFSKRPYMVSDLVRFGTLTDGMAEFIRACVQARLNIMVSGGTGSGKTTTLNAISGFLPPSDRIVTIEDSAELQLQQPHVIALETRTANVEGKGAVSIRELFRNALHMIPKRIVVGECRGAEALDMIHAMSSGNAGSLTTAHANSPKDMLARLETMIMMAGMNLTSRMIRELIASALHVVVHQERLADGRRRITHIAELTGIVDGEIQIEDVYRFVQHGVDDEGNVLGALKATGYVPRCLDRFFEDELKLAENLLEGVVPTSQLRADWERRQIELSLRDRTRTRAKIALQMALEDRAVGDEDDLLDDRPITHFGWKDAVASAAGTTRRGESLAEGQSSRGDTRRTGRLSERLATAKVPDTTQRMDADLLDQVQRFKRLIVARLSSLVAADPESLLFDSREEERRVVKDRIEKIVGEIAHDMRWHLTPRARVDVVERALSDVVGLGPIQRFMDDHAVSEIMVNGPGRVYVEIAGKLQRTDVTFESDAHVMHTIRRIITPLGRRCDDTTPMVDARTHEGFRVNAIVPPLSVVGPCLTIRKFSTAPMRIADLVAKGTLTHETAEFLRACIGLKLNIFVSGGTGSGKTTTLNAISEFIPESRIITIEDAAELRLMQRHVVSLETRPPNLEGRGQITIRDLVRNALHQRPDRIIVGECRGGEALDMISSMSTGNKGSLSTGHANSPADLIRRLETMIMMSGVELPLRAIREQIAAAVDLVIQQDRLSDGTRKITAISEVLPCDHTGVRICDIFRFRQSGIDPLTDRVQGRLEFTGAFPEFLLRFGDEGVALPDGVFGPSVSVPALLRDLDDRRRLEESRELRANRRKSRTYEEVVLLDGELFEREADPLALLENEGRTMPDLLTGGGATRFFHWKDALGEVKKADPRAKVLDADLKTRRAITEIIVHEDLAALLGLGEGERTGGERPLFVRALKRRITEVIAERRLFLTEAATTELAEELADDFLELGPIQKLMDDESVSEIMVNGPDKVYVERAGRVEKTEVTFRDDEHVVQMLTRVLTPIGRRCDMNSPLVDARTRHGYRLNAAIPPVSPGPVLTIRKFSRRPFLIGDLIAKGSLSREMAEFIYGCVQLKLNVIVSGGTGSGKTTMLNALSSFIPSTERIVTIEDTAELRLQQEHVVALETRHANQEGRGAVSVRELLVNSLRMQPNRIVVGECRGGEALDMLQAMNTGNSGSLTTAHASSPRDMMSRLETMALMARSTLTAKAIREQIASAIDVVIQVSRFRDGTRKVTHISEVRGIREESIELADVFVFEKAGLNVSGAVTGAFRPTGDLPSFLLRFAQEGIQLSDRLFGEGTSLTKLYERLSREADAREARELARARLRSHWEQLSQPEKPEDDELE
jgi:pilus assembly protein CpaF